MWVVLLVLLLPVIGIGLFIGITHVLFLAYHHTSPEPTPRIGPSYYLQEGTAIGTALSWNLVDRLAPIGQPEQHQGRRVLCVHGYTQNHTNWRALRHALRAAGRPHHAINLGLPPSSIERYGRRLTQEIEALLAASSEPIDVVCHSMGGIILRWVLNERPELASSIGSAITIGSPHQGTLATRLQLPVGREVAQMVHEGPFLSKLPSLCDLNPEIRVLCISSARDLIVYPQQSSHLPDSDEHLQVDEAGHIGLLTHPTVLSTVVTFLQRAH